MASKLSLGQVTIEFKLVPGSTKTLNGNIVLCNNTGAALPAGYYIDFFWPGFNIKDLSGAVGSASKPSTNVTRLKFETWMLPANGQCKTISVSSESTYGDDFLFPAFGTDSKGNKVTVVATDPKFIPQAYNAEPKEFYIQKDCFIPSPSSLCLGEAQFEEWNRIADVRVPSNRKGWALVAAHAHRMFTNMMGCEVTSLNFAFATSMIEGRMGCDAGFLPPTGDNNPLTYESHIGVDGCFQIRPLGWVQLEDFYPHIFTNLSKAPITDNGNFITACLSKTLYDYTSFTFWDQYFCYPEVKEFLCNMKDPYGGDAMFAYMYHKGWNHGDFANVFGANRNTWINSNNIANLLATNFPDINGGYAERVRNNIMRLENNVTVAGGPSLVVSTAQENWDPANYEYHGCYDAPFTWTEISAYIDEACRVFINADKVAVKAAAKAAFDAINGGAAVNFSKLGSVIDAIVLSIPLPSATRGMAGKYFSQAETCSKGNIRIKSYDKICVGQNAQMNVYLFGVPPFSYSIMAPDGSVFSKSGVTVPTDYYTVNQPGEYKIVSFSDANGAVDLKCNVARTTVENAGNSTAKWNKSSVLNSCASGALQIDLTGTAPFTIKYKDAAGVEKTVIINSSVSPYTLISGTVPTGTYVLTHLTAGGCDGPLNDSIKFCPTTCPFPSARISGSANICNGDSALITVALKGTSPFKIKYSNGNTKYTKSGITNNSFTFYAKVAGTYKVDSVWNANCDTLGKGSATITIKNSPTLIIGGDTTLCAGGSTNLSLNLSGTAPYNIVVTLGAVSLPYTSNVGSYNVAVTQPGLYTIELTDATGCKTVKKVNVITVAGPSLSMNNKTISICAGTSTTLLATVSGGSGSYTYLWSGKATGNTNSFVANSDGLHILQVTDSKGCKDKDTTTVTYSAGLNVNLINDTICEGETATISSGYSSPTYTFLWNTGATTSTITASNAGVYSVEVNNNGCKGNGSMTLVVNPLPAFDLGADKNICAGNSVVLNSGSINGNPTFTWTKAGIAVGNQASYTANTAGKYYLKITNENNCSTTDSILVNIVPSTVNIDFGGGTKSICAGTSLTLKPIVTGGDNVYSYQWSNKTTGNLDSLVANTAGTYTLEVSDSKGCKDKDSAIVSINANLNVYLSNDTICEGDSALVSSGYNGVGYTYLWNTGETTSSIKIKNIGVYSVTVNNSGCSGSGSMNLYHHSNPIVNLGADKNSCAGSTVTLNAGAGFTSYNWNQGVHNDSNFTTSNNGIHTVSVTNIYGCKASDSVNITVIANPQPNVLNDVELCLGSNYNFNVSSYNNGNGPYTYKWHNNSTANNFTINDISTNSFVFVDVIDQYGCVGRDSASITLKDKLADEISSNDTILCAGETAFLNSNFSQNNGYIINWSTGETSDNITLQNSSNISLIVTDSNGCSGSDQMAITFVANPDVSPIVDSVSICANETATLNALNDGYTYLWNTKETTQTIDVNSGGKYSVVISNGECFATANIIVKEIIMPQNFLQNNLPSNIICFEDEAPISIGTNLSNNYTFMWSTGESSPTINIDQAGEYILTVNNGNCISKDTIALTNYCESSIYVPNAFTPNGDGKNEIFKVKGAHIDDFEMLIFNRWGEVIYQSNDIGEGWNGTYLGNQVQQDVYVYKILYSITHTNGKKIKQERIGTVTPIQ